MDPAVHDQLIRIWALASVLGLIPAMIAYRKGRNFGLWWIYGSMLFIVALFHALLIRPERKRGAPIAKTTSEPHVRSLPEGIKHCRFCGQLIDELAAKCPVCKGVQQA